jgi:Flp pilus assembly protein TadG
MDHRITGPSRRRSLLGRRAHRSRGQSLVEFALVFPIFVMMMLGMIEFGFVFNAVLSVSYAARDAALVAAESGPLTGADCAILKSVEADVGAPASASKIQKVEIYQTDNQGVAVAGGLPTVYTRTGVANLVPCKDVDSSSVPYALSSDNYTELARCNVLGGCPSPPGPAGHATVDNIAVRVTYVHPWVTPLRNFAGGGAGGLTFSREAVMRMEPIL